MKREELKEWFYNEIPKIEYDSYGLFSTIVTIFEENEFLYSIQYDVYSCLILCCDDCPSRTSRGHCYEKFLSIYDECIEFDGKTYYEKDFEQLKNDILYN